MRNHLFHLMDRSRNLPAFAYICIILLFSGSMYPICANSETTELVAELSTDERASSTLKLSGMPLLSTDESDSSTLNVPGMPLLSTDKSDSSTLYVSEMALLSTDESDSSAGMPLLSTEESDSSTLNVPRMPLLSTDGSDGSTVNVSGTKVSKRGTYRSLWSRMPSLLVPTKELLHICLPHYDLLTSLRHNPNQSTKQPTEESVRSTFKVSGMHLLPTEESVSSTLKVSWMPLLTTEKSISSTFKVYGMTFWERLSNPCFLVNISGLNTFDVRSVVAAKDIYVRLMQHNGRHVRDSAEALITTSLMPDCPSFSSHRLPTVAIIPKIESNTSEIGALSLFYNSLLNHTALVNFIVEQAKQYDLDKDCNHPSLQENAYDLAIKMRELMCNLRVFALGVGAKGLVTSRESIDQILNGLLYDQPSCSHRAIRNCQIAHSTKTFATRFLAFIRTARFNN